MLSLLWFVVHRATLKASVKMIASDVFFSCLPHGKQVGLIVSRDGAVIACEQWYFHSGSFLWAERIQAVFREGDSKCGDESNPSVSSSTSTKPEPCSYHESELTV